jgi:hypothetical protein
VFHDRTAARATKEGRGTVEALLDAVADGVIVVHRRDQRDRDIRLVVENEVGHGTIRGSG